MRLSDADVADVVNDLKTPMTFLTGGTLDMARGNLGDFLDWWVVLRALIDGRAVHTRGVDRRSATATATRSTCTARSRPTTTTPTSRTSSPKPASCTCAAGSIPTAMDEISADMDRALPTYARGDGRSWWAQDRRRRPTAACACSTSTSTRHARSKSARANATSASAASPTTTTTARRLGNRIEALVKPIGVVEGISDVPWHKDCSLGMHSYRCCGLTTGISVTGADATSGQLRVVAGSHRALVQPAFVRRELGPARHRPADADRRRHRPLLAARCTCRSRRSTANARVMYTGFGLVERNAPSEARKQAIGAIGSVREGAYTTVSQAPGYVAK